MLDIFRTNDNLEGWWDEEVDMWWVWDWMIKPIECPWFS